MKQKKKISNTCCEEKGDGAVCVCVCPTLTFLASLVITVDLKDDYCYSCTPPPLSILHSLTLILAPCLTLFFFYLFLLARNGQNVWEAYANVCDNVIAKG